MNGLTIDIAETTFMTRADTKVGMLDLIGSLSLPHSEYVPAVKRRKSFS
jgi:hypothetical protein